ncbi:hypothetical protein N658DRAFT_501330 [Parathielavia hyrcaniae]|uniref:CinA C-terminal domain-containing protein n=1 Tax=Parathielavia hyrcaniae TaxID=113614 RepID=A0AAN6SXI2_9PEZI|nr:hypothetical protein N658DRAFT_501330 [Parathielavia hyrcaniae]
MASAPALAYVPHPTETVSHIATDITRLLRAANETLGVAESLTGGGVMAALTSDPGASAVFRGGVVSYATELKRELLGVDAALIAREGVIHGEVAAQMAHGARQVTSFADEDTMTNWGVGTTGVAGPDLQDGKPAGTVFIGVVGGDNTRVYGPFQFPGSREQVREAAVLEALARLRGALVEKAEANKGWSV